MQNTSTLYKQIVSEDNHDFEVALAIGESGRLITNLGEVLKFGDTSILVDSGGPETAFREELLWSMSTNHKVFSGDVPEAGGAIGGEIDITMVKPISAIPRKARLAPFVRAVGENAVSEWIPKGVFYVDTREESHNDDGLDIVTIHGYDAMLEFEHNYPSDTVNDYPMLDTDMVQFLADHIGITVDPRTWEIMDKGYTFPLPLGYSQREALGFIAASYGGNFIISDFGELLLVTIGGIPRETNYLIDHAGYILVFGDTRILL